MGNWRTVKIVGSMSSKDAVAVNNYLEDDEEFGCLHNGGLCGLPNWGQTSICYVGNLGERDFSVEDIKEELEKIVTFAPSLDIVVHAGGDNEDTECISSIVVKDQNVDIVEPLVDDIGKIPEDQIKAQLMKQLFKF